MPSRSAAREILRARHIARPMIDARRMPDIPGDSVGGVHHTVAVLAHNKHDMTGACLERVRASGFTGPLILIDNGSTPPLAAMAGVYDCLVVRNTKNRFVNPVWNDLIRECATRYLTLLNNDCLVRDGYLNEVVPIMEQQHLAVAAATRTPVPDILNIEGGTAMQEEPPIVDVGAVCQGHMMTIDLALYRLCEFRIPDRYLIWCGDTWIWGQLRENGHRCGVLLNRTFHGQRHGTIDANPEFRPITVRDYKRLKRSKRMMQMRLLSGAISQADYDWWFDTHTIRGFSRRAHRVLRRYLRLDG